MFDEKLGFDPGPIATVQELLNVEIRECGEPLVLLDPQIFVIQSPELPWLREGYAKLLLDATEEMRLENQTLRLLIHYAHRSPVVQRRNFDAVFAQLNADHADWSEAEILAEAHRQNAYPDVAGHPTGGSVDISIWDDAIGKEIDMPTIYDDFTVPAGSYRKYLKCMLQQSVNAQYLEQLLARRGIYPYPGEWWHFDYGNREWAWGTGQPYAIYGPISPPQ